MKRRRKNSRRESEVTITSFCAILIEDHSFIKEPCILMVRNVADKDRPPPENPLYDGTKPYIARRQGKREGIGLPGGGERAGNMDSPTKTAANELLSETGFKGKNMRGLFVQPKIILTRRGEKRAEIPFKVGEPPPYDLPHGHTAIGNVVCVYSGEIDWEGSSFRKILLSIKRADGITEEMIRNEGLYVWFDDLNDQEFDSLNIEEDDEISMMGIFPVSLIAFILKKGFPEWSNDFYKSHVIRAAGACLQMEVMKEEFEEAFAEFRKRGGKFIHTPYDQATSFLRKISSTLLA